MRLKDDNWRFVFKKIPVSYWCSQNRTALHCRHRHQTGRHQAAQSADRLILNMMSWCLDYISAVWLHYITANTIVTPTPPAPAAQQHGPTYVAWNFKLCFVPSPISHYRSLSSPLPSTYPPTWPDFHSHLVLFYSRLKTLFHKRTEPKTNHGDRQQEWPGHQVPVPAQLWGRWRWRGGQHHAPGPGSRRRHG